MEFTITSEEILGFCGFIITIGGVWKLWKEIKKPKDEDKKMLLDHEGRLNDIEDKLKSIGEENKMNLQCMLCLINHDITGNGIEQLKHQRDELQEFLINK